MEKKELSFALRSRRIGEVALTPVAQTGDDSCSGSCTQVTDMQIDDRFCRVQSTWESLGNIDPMWAILTDPSKLGQRWSEEEFFDSGRLEIARIVEEIDRLKPGNRKNRALDFGCGIGRLSRALCDHYERVDGIDVASSMIDIAKRKNSQPTSCFFTLNEAPDLRLFPDESFDLIYCTLVLQHMPTAIAMQYLVEFVRCSARGGMLVFQAPHAPRFNRSWLRRCIVNGVYSTLPTPLVTWYRRRKHRDLPRLVIDRLPKIAMEMHCLRRRSVEDALAKNCRLLALENVTDEARDPFTSYLYFFERI